MANFSDRYYRALFELLLRVQLNKPTKLDEFFSLIFKSVKADLHVGRTIAFIKRLLQMCYINEASYTAACILIISEILNTRDDIRYTLFKG